MPDDFTVPPPGQPTGLPPAPQVPQAPQPSPSVRPDAAPQPAVPSKSKKRKLALIIACVVFVLLLAAGYAYAFYLPKQPGNMYKAGLANTGKAVDKLVDYTAQQQGAEYKSLAFSGAAHVRSASASYDINASGSADKSGNASVAVDADVMGEKFQGELRSVKTKDNAAPDIYLKTNNAKNVLGRFGLEKYDGKWVVIDHTILDSYARLLQANTAVEPKMQAPTTAQLLDAATRLQTVNKAYLFTTDPEKAVLQNEKFIGKEKLLHDRQAYHYQVGYHKDHLKTYLAEAKKALDGSQLNDWAKAANGKNISEQAGYADLQKAVQDAKSDYRFDIWIDESTRVVSQLQFADPSDKSATFTIAQHYTGQGDVYPFSFGLKSKDKTGKPQSGTLDVTLDAKSRKVKAVFAGKVKDAEGRPSELNVNLTMTPSAEAVKVTPPSGAASVNDVLATLMTRAMSQTVPAMPDNPAAALPSQMPTYR